MSSRKSTYNSIISLSAITRPTVNVNSAVGVSLPVPPPVDIHNITWSINIYGLSAIYHWYMGNIYVSMVRNHYFFFRLFVNVYQIKFCANGINLDVLESCLFYLFRAEYCNIWYRHSHPPGIYCFYAQLCCIVVILGKQKNSLSLSLIFYWYQSPREY